MDEWVPEECGAPEECGHQKIGRELGGQGTGREVEDYSARPKSLNVRITLRRFQMKIKQ